MKITKLISKLSEIQETHGDIDVACVTTDSPDFAIVPVRNVPIRIFRAAEIDKDKGVKTEKYVVLGVLY